MELLNKIVVHKVFGEGTVITAESNLITIDFNGTLKKFAFPGSFEKFLEFQDIDSQKEVEKLLKEELTAPDPSETKSATRTPLIPEGFPANILESLKRFEEVVPKYNWADYRTSNKAYTDDDFCFFYGHRATKKPTKYCLSQWYKCTFTDEMTGLTFNCAEQYMMFNKAVTFEDFKHARMILDTADPGDMKALGRKVTNYDSHRWSQVNRGIVQYGNYFKFSQNPELKEFLLSTGEQILVEASPSDGIWGIKMAQDAPGITNPRNWNGSNYLGFAIMGARDMLK